MFILNFCSFIFYEMTITLVIGSYFLSFFYLSVLSKNVTVCGPSRVSCKQAWLRHGNQINFDVMLYILPQNCIITWGPLLNLELLRTHTDNIHVYKIIGSV